jgi:phosphoenolpyruvate phosphomutase
VSPTAQIAGGESDRSLTPSKGSCFKGLLEGGDVVRIVGVNDGLTALLAERNGFEALWASGLGISAAHGVPDASIATMTDFFQAAQVIDRSSRLPVVADCDTGFGDVNVVAHMVRTYEHAGVAAICIEDKLFPKRNSFTDDGQILEEPAAFATKIAGALAARQSADFLVLARLESFIAGLGLDDVLRRACLYREAGADALVIHSKKAEPDEIEAFARAWRSAELDLPLIVIPTTYPTVTIPRLHELGIDGVIYANQGLRATIRAVDKVLARIAREGTCAGVESDLATVAEVLDLLGTDEIRSRDAWFLRELQRRRTANHLEAVAS